MIKENCARAGVRIVKTKVADATQLRLARPADRILVDAPCSGLGVIGRKGDIRWSRDSSSIAELRALQLKLLDNAACLLKPGGRLVYSTCTTVREENEETISKFLDQHKNFELLEELPRVSSELVTKDGFVRTWPQRHGMAGSFAAALVKVS